MTTRRTVGLLALGLTGIGGTLTAAAEPSPVTKAPADLVIANPPIDEAAATAHAAPSTRGLAVGVGLRTAFAVGREGQGLDHLNVEPRFRARITPSMSFEVTLSFGRDYRVDYPAPPAQTEVELTPVETNNVLDAVAKLEPSPYFNVWIGRFIPPSDRDALAGQYYQTAWNAPRTVFRYPATFAGTDTEAAAYTWGRSMAGRDEGVAFWGQLGGGAFKYQVGIFNLHLKPTKDPRYAARLTLNLLDPEPGYYNQTTYYGKKDLLAFGFAMQVQDNSYFGYREPVPVDPNNPATGGWRVEMNSLRARLVAVSVDGLFEKRLGSSGTLTLQGAFFRGKEALPRYATREAQIPAGTAVDPVNSWLGLVAYLLPWQIGPGRLQPMFRWQQQLFDITHTATFGPRTYDAVKDVWTMDAFINYVIDGHNLRVAVGYQHTRINDDERPQFINIGVQAQY